MRRSARLSQDFRWYDSSRDGDGDCVRQVYAAQFVPGRIQIPLYAGERQIQKPSNVMICLASRRPDQTFLLSFRQFERIRLQFEIEACSTVDQNSHWLELDHIPRFVLCPIILRVIARERDQRTDSFAVANGDRQPVVAQIVISRIVKKCSSGWIILGQFIPVEGQNRLASTSDDRIDSGVLFF